MSKEGLVIGIGILVFSFSCSDNSDNGGPVSIRDTAAGLSLAKADASRIPVRPDTIVFNFLRWYVSNRKNLNDIALVNNAGGTYDSTKFYSVNFSNTEKYLGFFKESGFVSDKYLDYWIGYFKKADDYLKKNPQNDGPPVGLDYDFITVSQEPDEDLSNVNKSIVLAKSVKDSNAVVRLKLSTGRKLEFLLTAQGNRWVIDKINGIAEK